MAIAKIVGFEPLRSLSYTAISGAYAPLGTPTDFPSKIIKLQNTTDAAVFISFDGVTAVDILPAGAFTLYDFSSNSYVDWGFELKKGTQFYVSQVSAVSLGAVYLTCVYAIGQ